MGENTKTSDIIFCAVRLEYTLHDSDGTMLDETDYESEPGPDFTSLEEALAWVRAEAARDKLEIVTGTRHGNGTVSRNIYEICARRYDEDEEEWVPCSYKGEPWENNKNEYVDVLDLHPEVRRAWMRANGSFCEWLDYKSEDYCGFRMTLEDELGEDWNELDYIRWIG